MLRHGSIPNDSGFAWGPKNDEFFWLFFFLNSGIVGPFHSTDDGLEKNQWPLIHLKPLVNNIGLTGLSLNCAGKLGKTQAHVQSMLWATNRQGMRAIRASRALFDCEGISMGYDSGDPRGITTTRDQLINQVRRNNTTLDSILTTSIISTRIVPHSDPQSHAL